MLLPPLRFLLRSFRLSSSARWLLCCRAAVAVAELFAAAAAGDTLRCCFLALLSCPPPLVLVLVMLLFFVLLFSSGDSTATVTALQSGRNPKRHAANPLHPLPHPLTSLFSRCCCLRSHFPPLTSNFASSHRLRCQSAPPFASPSPARRNARSDEITTCLSA